MNYGNGMTGQSKGSPAPAGSNACPKKSKLVDQIVARLEQAKPEAPKPLKPSLVCCPHALPEDAPNG